MCKRNLILSLFASGAFCASTASSQTSPFEPPPEDPDFMSPFGRTGVPTSPFDANDETIEAATTAVMSAAARRGIFVGDAKVRMRESYERHGCNPIMVGEISEREILTHDPMRGLGSPTMFNSITSDQMNDHGLTGIEQNLSPLDQKSMECTKLAEKVNEVVKGDYCFRNFLDDIEDLGGDFDEQVAAGAVLPFVVESILGGLLYDNVKEIYKKMTGEEEEERKEKEEKVKAENEKNREEVETVTEEGNRTLDDLRSSSLGELEDPSDRAPQPTAPEPATSDPPATDPSNRAQEPPDPPQEPVDPQQEPVDPHQEMEEPRIPEPQQVQPYLEPDIMAQRELYNKFIHKLRDRYNQACRGLPDPDFPARMISRPEDNSCDRNSLLQEISASDYWTPDQDQIPDPSWRLGNANNQLEIEMTLNQDYSCNHLEGAERYKCISDILTDKKFNPPRWLLERIELHEDATDIGFGTEDSGSDDHWEQETLGYDDYSKYINSNINDALKSASPSMDGISGGISSFLDSGGIYSGCNGGFSSNPRLMHEFR